jgi:hypothetical protein
MLRNFCFVALSCVLFLNAVRASNGQSYDARQDFSIANNPNGAWSYGMLSSTTGGTFTLYNTTMVNAEFPGSIEWNNGSTSVPNYSGVIKNTTSSTASWAGVNQLPPNLLAVAPENSSADVRWESPATGLYDVSGFFQRIDTTSSQPLAMGIVENGTTTLFSVTNFITFNDPAPFSFSDLSFPVGTTLDFYAFATGQPYDIGGGLAATITSVPEPSTWNGPGGGSFNLASNWSNKSIPNGVDAIANFSTNITALSTVTLDSPVTLGTLNFNSLQSYTIAGASSLTLQTSSGNASINVQAGSHEISVPIMLNSDTVINGPGIIELSGGISGAHTLTVLGTLTATSVQVDTLIIGGAGATAVPEPSTFVLFGLGAFGLLAWAWRRRRT